jgi:hypothetical protein
MVEASNKICRRQLLVICKSDMQEAALHIKHPNMQETALSNKQTIYAGPPQILYAGGGCPKYIEYANKIPRSQLHNMQTRYSTVTSLAIFWSN